jgi:hypothetical protein
LRMRKRYAADPEYRERERERRRERHRNDAEYRERERERRRERYWNMSGFEYNRELLRLRRQKALKRMAERNARRAA